MKIVEMKVADLVPYERNPRHNDEAVDYVAESIKQFGFNVPIVIDKDNTVVCGHTRLKAAKKLKIKTVPCVVKDDLTDEEIRAYRLADNRSAEKATWDIELLDMELAEIDTIDMGLLGFEDNEEEESDNDIGISEGFNEGYNVIIQCEDLKEAEALAKLLHVDLDFTRQKIACKYSDISV